MENPNSEKFIFIIGRLIFKCTQPGKETRKTVALVGGIFILVLILFVLVIYFLKINVLQAALFSSSAIIASRWINKPKSCQDFKGEQFDR